MTRKKRIVTMALKECCQSKIFTLSESDSDDDADADSESDNFCFLLFLGAIASDV